MKVFVSWSGERSHAVALALRTWLPSVLQSVEPYVSSEDIDKGARWSTDIARRLDETSYGIVCVTRDNVTAPWVNFEAGALAKSFDASRVTPLLLDLAPSDVTGPLAQFQMTSPTLEDMTRLVLGLNTVTENPIDPARLTEAVDLWWPKLHVAFAAIPPATSAPQSRPQSEILAELLDVARSTQQQVARLEEHAPRRGVHPVSGPDLGQGHRDWSDANVTLFVCDFLSRRGIPIDGASTSGSNVLVFLQEPVPEARCDQLRRQLQTTSGLSVGFVQPPTDVPDGPETEVTPMQ